MVMEKDRRRLPVAMAGTTIERKEIDMLLYEYIKAIIINTYIHTYIHTYIQSECVGEGY